MPEYTTEGLVEWLRNQVVDWKHSSAARAKFAACADKLEFFNAGIAQTMIEIVAKEAAKGIIKAAAEKLEADHETMLRGEGSKEPVPQGIVSEIGDEYVNLADRTLYSCDHFRNGVLEEAAKKLDAKGAIGRTITHHYAAELVRRMKTTEGREKGAQECAETNTTDSGPASS